MLLCAIQIILALVVLGVAVVAAYIWMQGDAKMFFDVKKRTAAVKVNETEKRLDFAVELDYKNVVLVPAGTGKTMVLRFEAYAKNGKTIAEAMANIPDVDVALIVECRGRGALYTEKKYITLTAEEMRALI